MRDLKDVTLERDSKNLEAIEAKLVDALRKIIVLKPEEGDVDLTEDFLASGLVDSFGFISLLTFVEDFYGVKIEEDEQFDDRLRTISGLASFVSEKTDGA